MTVTYTAEVATCKHFGCFTKLLLRWRGGIYKLVYADLILFLVLYITLRVVYESLSKESQLIFESAVYLCRTYGGLIPLSFVLGFFCSIVMRRWWDQYMTIPWPDTLAVFVSAHVHGNDERARVMRRTVMRYACLCLTMVLSMIAPRVKKRFPNFASLVEAGLMQESEKRIMESMDAEYPIAKYPKHWMPIVWACSIIIRARNEGKIRDDYAVKTIIDELNMFRGMCGFLLYYDWVSVPLVYTQVVTLAVYMYFLTGLIGLQMVGEASKSVEAVFPILTITHFFFYMGWLKVAETLINPFGNDDDDFEVNWMIDRNLLISYLIVDEMHQEYPQLVKDQYWDEVFPDELPYANEADRSEPPAPSTAKLGLNNMTSEYSMLNKKASMDTQKDVEEAKRQSDNYTGRLRFLQPRQSSSSSIELDYDRNICSRISITRSSDIFEEELGEEEIEDEETPQSVENAEFIRAEPGALDLDQLIELRDRERRERMRNRFLNIRSLDAPTRTGRLMPNHLLSDDDGEEEDA